MMVNGAMEVAQRLSNGAHTFNSGGYYGVDMFNVRANTSITISHENDYPENLQRCSKKRCDTMILPIVEILDPSIL